MNAKIVSVGSYIPINTVTNKDLEKTVDTTDEWIISRTGIKQRPIAEPSQATSDLALEASRIAIERANIDNSDIDLIIVGTCTPDVATPNVGTLIQKRLGLSNFPAFSIEAACSGFIYALNIADKFIKSGESKCALVVGAWRVRCVGDVCGVCVRVCRAHALCVYGARAASLSMPSIRRSVAPAESGLRGLRRKWEADTRPVPNLVRAASFRT